MLKNLFISTILIIATIAVPVYSENSSSSSTQSSAESSQSSLSSQSSSDNSSLVSSNQSSSQSLSSISNQELLAQTESEEQKETETLKVDLKPGSSQKRQLLVQLKTPKTNKDLENLLLKETPIKPLPIRASSNEEITSPSNLLLVQAKPEENLTDLANKIKDLPEVESVQTNNPYQFDSLTPTNNPNYASDQWYLKDSNTNPMGTYAQSAWQTVATALGSGNSGGSSDVKIAVIDSGVNTGLADFAGVNIANSSRFFSKTTSCNPLDGEIFLAVVYEDNSYICRKDGTQFDEVGHGTAVAGVIFMQDNSLNGVGVAHKTTLMPIALHSGAFNTFGVAKAIRYAVDNGAKVINLSLGTPYNDLPVKAEIDYAVSQGVSVVASSGNCGNKTAIQCYPFLTTADPEYYVGTNVVSYPAAYPAVIAVGAINPDGTKSNYSTAGSYVDVVAPVGQTGVSGGAVYSICGVVTVAGPCFGKTLGDGSYWTGTSFSAPQVAGAIGLLRSVNNSYSVSDIEYLLQLNAYDIGPANYDISTGYGNLNINKLINAPTVQITNPTNNQSLNYFQVPASLTLSGTANFNSGSFSSADFYLNNNFVGTDININDGINLTAQVDTKPNIFRLIVKDTNGSTGFSKINFSVLDKWSVWTPNGITLNKISMTTFNNRIYQSVRSLNDSVYIRSSSDGVTFNEWQLLDGKITNEPELGVIGGRLVMAVRGLDGFAYTRSSTNGTNWSAWSKNGITLNKISMTTFNNRIYQSVRSLNDSVYIRSSSDGVTFNEWQLLDGKITNEPELGVIGGRLVMAVRGLDGFAYTRSSTNGTNWSAWSKNGITLNKISMTTFNNRIYQSVRSLNDSVYIRSSSDGVTFNEWQLLDGKITNEPELAESVNDKLMITVRGVNGLVHNSYSSTPDAPSSFTTWTTDGLINDSPTALMFNGKPIMSARGKFDDAVYTKYGII